MFALLNQLGDIFRGLTLYVRVRNLFVYLGKQQQYCSLLVTEAGKSCGNRSAISFAARSLSTGNCTPCNGTITIRRILEIVAEIKPEINAKYNFK